MTEANPADRDPILDKDLSPSLRAAAAMFRDIHGRRPITIVYTKPPLCPHCRDTLYLETVRTDWFPYLHTDYTLTCPTCQARYLYGVALTHDAGLSLIIWDTNPAEAIAYMMKQRSPFCPFHSNPMTPTKIFRAAAR